MKTLGRSILIALVFLLPLTMHLGMMDSFDLPKMVLVYLAVTTLLCVWLIKGIVSGQFIWKTSPLDVPLLVYLFVLGLATIFSSNFHVSLWGQYREYAFGFLPTMAFAVLFWMTVQFSGSKKWISALVRSVAVSGCLVAVYAIMQYLGYELFTGMPKAEGTRIWATLGNPIYLGAFLAMVIPVVLGELFFGKGTLKRIPWLTFLVAMGAALIFTLSRSAWVGLAAALTIFVFMCCRRHYYLLYALALVTFFVAALFVHQPARQRFLSILNPSESSNAARIAGWQAAWEIFKEQPVLGAGPDTFKETFRAKRNKAYVQATGPYTTQNHVHNDLLQIAATSGVLGLGVYLWIVITVTVMTIKLLRRLKLAATKLDSRFRGNDDTEKLDSGSWIGLFCGLAALFGQNQFNFSTVTTSALAAVFAGVLCAIYTRGEKVPFHGSSFPQVVSGNPACREQILDSRLRHSGMTTIGTDFFTKKFIKNSSRLLLAGTVIILASAMGTLCWRTLHADVAFKDGLALVSAQDFRQAIARLEDAIRFNPNVVDYRLAQANIYRDMAAGIPEPEMRLPFLRKALVQAQEIVRVEPRNPDSYTNLGVTWMWLTQLAGKEHRQEAWNAFRRAVEIDQFSVETWAHLARTAHFLGDVEKEKKLWLKVLEIYPEHSTAKQLLGQSS